MTSARLDGGQRPARMHLLYSASKDLVCQVELHWQYFGSSPLFDTEYAAAFFLLGGSLKDAINVCIKQIKDFQLAVALARIVEGSNEGPILRDILTNTVLPIAFELGNRYLGSWAFWLLHRRDLAVRILLVCL
jgi:hypothetical protein